MKSLTKTLKLLKTSDETEDEILSKLIEKANECSDLDRFCIPTNSVERPEDYIRRLRDNGDVKFI